MNIDTFVFELGHKVFGHVEAGGWSGSRAELFGPDCLVTFNVFWIGVTMKVWWERYGAVSLDNVCEWAGRANGGGAVAENLGNRNSVISKLAVALGLDC